MSARRAVRPYLCQSSARRANIISATDIAVKELLVALRWSFVIT